MRPPPNSEHFAAVYQEHVWVVYGFFGYRVRSRQEAEDLTQVTFERGLKAWTRFDPDRASERTWLLAIARNLLIDHYRRDEPARATARDPEDELGRLTSSAQDPAASEVDLGLSADLNAALGSLGPRERELIALRFGGELSGPEIAELTGLSLANVQQILSRALRRLRDDLAPHARAAGRTGIAADQS